MTKSFVSRIIDYHYNLLRDYERGKYTYNYNENDGCIRRCLVDDVGRQWIDSDGERYDSWEVYLTGEQVKSILEGGC